MNVKTLCTGTTGGQNITTNARTLRRVLIGAPRVTAGGTRSRAGQSGADRLSGRKLHDVAPAYAISMEDSDRELRRRRPHDRAHTDSRTRPRNRGTGALEGQSVARRRARGVAIRSHFFDRPI